MAITITKPTVGGSNGTWGTELNTALDTIVNGVNTNTTDVGARLPTNTYAGKGDLVAGTGVGTVARQGIGADKYVLTADSTFSTGMTWKPAPGGIVCKLRATSTQSVGTGTFATLAMHVADYDRTGTFTSGSTTFTPGVAGWYELSGGVAFDNPSSAGTVRMSGWRVSGTDVPGSYNTQAANTGGIAECVPARTIAVNLSASDTVTLIGWHNRGATVSTVIGTPYCSVITITYLGT